MLLFAMDELDIRAVNHLMKSGRATWAELSGVLGLSSPSTADRVRRLEESGVIRGYAAIVDPVRVGCTLTAFVSVTVEHPKYRALILERLKDLDAVQECHHVTGDYDYLLKVRATSPAHLEHIISNDLKELPGVSKTYTIVALSTVKETTELPLNRDAISQSVPFRN
ncbi:MAG: Lrp/AsnC family transcriptional regulator [Terriglobales bacterium]